jgi:hypothetical protein
MAGANAEAWPFDSLLFQSRAFAPLRLCVKKENKTVDTLLNTTYIHPVKAPQCAFTRPPVGQMCVPFRIERPDFVKDELVTQPGSVLPAERLTFAHPGCANIIPRPKADRHKEDKKLPPIQTSRHPPV